MNVEKKAGAMPQSNGIEPGRSPANGSTWCFRAGSASG